MRAAYRRLTAWRTLVVSVTLLSILPTPSTPFLHPPLLLQSFFALFRSRGPLSPLPPLPLPSFPSLNESVDAALFSENMFVPPSFPSSSSSSSSTALLQEVLIIGNGEVENRVDLSNQITVFYRRRSVSSRSFPVTVSPLKYRLLQDASGLSEPREDRRPRLPYTTPSQYSLVFVDLP